MTESVQGLVPVIIGIVGHRDLRPLDLESMTDALRRILGDLVERASGTPVWLLTSLAQGADQVAAEVGAGIEGVELVAVLPMPLEEYATDFAVGEERDRFRAFVGACSRVLVADDLVASGPVMAAGGYVEPQARDAAYRRCARLISDCSHVLIAAWDGKPTRLPGGTGDTIAYRTLGGKGVSAGEEGLWGPLGGLTIQVPVGRMAHDDEPSLPDASGPAVVPQVIKTVCGDVGGSNGSGMRQWAANAPDLVVDHLVQANARLGHVPSKRVVAWTGRCARLMETYDQEAMRLQVRYRMIASGLLIAGVLVLLVVSVEQSMTFGWMLGFAVVAIGLTGGLWWGLTRIGLKARFHVARAIAEGARVQVAWAQCGVRACVADSYLHGEPDLQWVRRLLNAAWFADVADHPLVAVPAARRIEAAHAWIEGQVDYFAGSSGRAGAIARNRARAHRYERASTAGVTIAFISLIPEGMRLWTPASIPEWLTLGAQSGWELGVSTAAACLAYAQLMAFGETGRRYEVSLRAFRQALTQIRRIAPSDVSGIERVARDIGEEALAETASWLAMHRERSVRPI